MGYLAREVLNNLGFKKLGRNVLVSDRASLYNTEQMEIGDNSRIDDFCVMSGNIKIGRNVHITPQCLVAGGIPGIEIGDFIALAYGVKVFAQSDDYSGLTMTNSTVPKEFKMEIMAPVKIGRHSIIGAGSIIMPGINIGEGNAIGANSLVLRSTEDWQIYAGSPVKKIKERRKDLLDLEHKYLESEK
jgi:acetyltransferase-like isoleucine patch superfamily enzyme